MNNIQIVKSLEPYCFQLDYKLDYPKLMASMHMLLERLGQDINIINQKIVGRELSAYLINLTHLPGLTGTDRFLKHNGGHRSVKNEGVHEADFSEHLAESQDLYIGQVIRDLYDQHNGKFQGRASLVWLGPKFQYAFHIDPHTPNRYHVPLITNEECYFLLRNTETFQVHMPAGTAWYLDPIGIQHTFVNNSNTPRLHLLLTSGF